MRRSSTDKPALHPLLAVAALLVAAALSGAPAARAQSATAGPERFVDVVELIDHEDQADISVQFNCSVRYVTHQPQAEGTMLRVQLQPLPDCGLNPGSQIAGELPPLSGGAKIIAGVRLESDVPGQLTLVFEWRKAERFVVAQGVDPRGLRIRLIDRARGRGKIFLNQPLESVSNFAINLDSQPKPFTPDEVGLAHERLKAPVFLSEALVDGERWYRLRVGPIERRADAEKLLNAALADYPRAWLAIGDDAVTTRIEGSASELGLPAVEKIGSDPALDPTTLARLLSEARAALAARKYDAAITLLTKLQRQPEFPARVQAQELLGLARERAGQLAHAKAEYQEYLARYPKGEGAERVTARLKALRSASARSRTRGEGAGEGGRGWQLSGGFAQLFRYDGTKVDNIVPPGSSSTVPTSSTTTTQDAVISDFDLLARRRGDRFDLIGRLSVGYGRNFAATSNGDTKRISLASFDLTDHQLGLSARLGRQSRNQDGVLGTFDGLALSYQWRPAWAVNLVAGYPVEQTSVGLRTERRFETLALAYTPPGSHWDARVFAATQQFDGVRDRQAAGFEWRYLDPHKSLIALLDYDTFYKSLNAGTLIGTLQLPARWALSFDAERRNAPILTTRNALIGQPATSIAELEQVFTEAQIFQLARNRTAITSNYSLTATHPLGERVQFATTVAATETGATAASGGVDAQPATGLDLSYQAQLYGANLWREGDFHVLSAAWSKTETGKDLSLGLTSRFRLAGAWRLGPRLSLDRRTLVSDGSTELQVLPSLLIDYQQGRRLFQFELGGQLGRRDALDQTQNSKRYYVSAAYRLAF